MQMLTRPETVTKGTKSDCTGPHPHPDRLWQVWWGHGGFGGPCVDSNRTQRIGQTGHKLLRVVNILAFPPINILAFPTSLISVARSQIGMLAAAASIEAALAATAAAAALVVVVIVGSVV
jgi:hypothetical protein